MTTGPASVPPRSNNMVNFGIYHQTFRMKCLLKNAQFIEFMNAVALSPSLSLSLNVTFWNIRSTYLLLRQQLHTWHAGSVGRSFKIAQLPGLQACFLNKEGTYDYFSRTKDSKICTLVPKPICFPKVSRKFRLLGCNLMKHPQLNIRFSMYFQFISICKEEFRTCKGNHKKR